MDKKHEVNPNSQDYQFGMVVTKIDALDKKIDALDDKYMWAAGIIAFSVSTFISIIVLVVGK